MMVKKVRWVLRCFICKKSTSLRQYLKLNESTSFTIVSILLIHNPIRSNFHWALSILTEDNTWNETSIFRQSVKNKP